MPLTSIEPSRLYRQIAEQLRAMIVSGEYPPGARLPPERDLARQMGVSRPSVREALIALEVEGYIDIRIGSGIYVRRAEAIDMGSVVREADGPLELTRARAVIEPQIAALAARNIRRDEIARVRATIAAMESEAAAGRIPIDADRDFHVHIAAASGNGVLATVVGQLFNGRQSPLFSRLAGFFENPKSWAAAIAEHKRVLAALEARDPQAAAQAMHEHLQHAHRRFTAGWPETPPPPDAGRRPASRKESA
ncbi:MAG: FadR family transcriptional regulator [Burkholderiales bacterium]|nr:FadR family transcriptional regulator [Burkholderiales bacterium]